MSESYDLGLSSFSAPDLSYVPFNHGKYLDTRLYSTAQLLDNLYYANNPNLLSMYFDLERLIREQSADVLLVDNIFPYHPEFLRRLNVYKVMHTTDGPMSAYNRDFAYVHAYDHVLYHSPAYSRELNMPEKLRYCGAKVVDFWPLYLFDTAFDVSKDDKTILAHERDIDIIFIGSMNLNKMPILAKVKKAFRGRCMMHGITNIKRNVYFNIKYGFPGWIRPISHNQYVPLYQRSKIGINVHNRGDYTVGSLRLFELAGNGVMQISDGGEHLDEFFKVGEEIVAYKGADDLIDRINYYLANDGERRRIALNGYKRATKDYRFDNLLRKAGTLISQGREKIGWRHSPHTS